MLVRYRGFRRLTPIVSVAALFLAWGAPIVSAVPFNLAVTASGEGTGKVTSNPPGIDCPSDCSETYEQGTTVTLTAWPGGASHFEGWLDGGCSNQRTCSITITADSDVTATFVKACSYDPSSRELSIRIEPTYAFPPEGGLDSFGVKRLSVEAGNIIYEQQPCAGGTVVNVDAVKAAGDIPLYLIIDLGESGFAPGATPESSGVSEIELALDVQRTDGGEVFLIMMATDGPETIVLGDQGWNVNGDDDVDIVLAGVGSVDFSAEGGADLLSGRGGRGTGSATTLKVSLSGGDGRDRVVGTDLKDRLAGEAGRDVLIGRQSRDELFGGERADVLRGGEGDDLLFGGDGADRLIGGQDFDRCFGKKGPDRTFSCEKGD